YRARHALGLLPILGLGRLVRTAAHWRSADWHPLSSQLAVADRTPGARLCLASAVSRGLQRLRDVRSGAGPPLLAARGSGGGAGAWSGCLHGAPGPARHVRRQHSLAALVAMEPRALS